MSETLPVAADAGRTMQTPMPTILVPLDGTRHSASALPVARALAELEHATLHIVHVATRPLTPGALLGQLQLDQARVHGAVISPLVGPPGQAIAQYALTCRARFIAMCPRTGAERSEGALGSVARAVVAATPCPVVLVPPALGGRQWALRRLVLCHDGAPASSAAHGPAADLAQRSGAELDVLHVAGPQAVPGTEPGTLRVPRYVDQPQHEWEAWQQEFLDRVRGVGRGAETVHLHLHLDFDKPASAIVRFAVDHQSDLVILAWRGHLEPDRALILRAILSAAPCPVLVVRVTA